eukprot:11154233-Alexandrium_andersonii.AAC.1
MHDSGPASHVPGPGQWQVASSRRCVPVFSCSPVALASFGLVSFPHGARGDTDASVSHGTV